MTGWVRDRPNRPRGPRRAPRGHGVVVGQARFAAGWFTTCTAVGRLGNRVGVDTEEQDEPIVVCRGLTGPWRALWPQVQHLD